MGDLRRDLPPEHTELGVQMDDIFIPSPALQRRRFKNAATTVLTANKLATERKRDGKSLGILNLSDAHSETKATEYTASDVLD